MAEAAEIVARVELQNAQRGNRAEAFKWLEKGYAERSFFCIFLKAWAFFDPLRSAPRFQDLLRRGNFPE
jgi:hypothetical protein